MATQHNATEHLEPYEPTDAGYDWDYDEHPDAHGMPKILWGRVAALGGFLLLAFLLGRMTAGGGIPQDQFDEMKAQRDGARQEVTQLQGDVQGLEDELAAANTGDTPATNDTGEETTEAEEPEGTEELEGETYVVKAGDRLSLIAEEFYGDASLDDYIAEYNDITDPTLLRVDQEIIIPPKPD